MSTRSASTSTPVFLCSWSCGERDLSTASLTHLLLTILPKVRQETTWLILLAPAWLRQFWLQHPAFVPTLLYSELSQILHPNLTSFHIILWKPCGFQALYATCSSSVIFSATAKRTRVAEVATWTMFFMWTAVKMVPLSCLNFLYYLDCFSFI